MCINPITIKDPSNPRRSYTVPCGHCMECKRKYQSGWSIRLNEHLKSVGYKAVFFTLTYADECIPKNYLVNGTLYRTPSDYAYDKGSSYTGLDDLTGEVIDFSNKSIIDYNSLSNEGLALFYQDQTLQVNRENPDRIYKFNSVRIKDVQDWLKRGRRTYHYHNKKAPKIKYFISSEYGPHTFRPHYHGVMFGISKIDFDRYFKSDWVEHFGRKSNANICVISEDVNPSAGGMDYVTKYCSKGVFEHPLCAKDFFYFHKTPDGHTTHTEYHSKHYERCIEYFDVDFPLVDRPIKLISLGLGSSFLDKDEVLNYYAAGDDVNISSAITYDLRPMTSDSVSFLGLTKLDVDSQGNLYHTDEAHTPVPYYVKKDGKFYAKSYFLDGEPIKHLCHVWEGTFYSDKLYNKLIDLQKKLKYNKNGRDKRTGEQKVFSYSLPKYYREKMFSAEIQHLLTCAVLEEHVNLYQEQFKQLQTDNPTWSDAEIMAYIDCQEKQERDFRRQQLSERMIEDYSKSLF